MHVGHTRHRACHASVHRPHGSSTCQDSPALALNAAMFARASTYKLKPTKQLETFFATEGLVRQVAELAATTAQVELLGTVEELVACSPTWAEVVAIVDASGLAPAPTYRHLSPLPLCEEAAPQASQQTIFLRFNARGSWLSREISAPPPGPPRKSADIGLRSQLLHRRTCALILTGIISKTSSPKPLLGQYLGSLF